MSTQIYAAWQTPKNFDIADSIALAKETAKIQKNSMVKKIIWYFCEAGMMSDYPDFLTILQEKPDAFGKVVAAAISSEIKHYSSEPFIIFPASREDALLAVLRRHKDELGLNDLTLEAMFVFCKEIYERFNYYDGSLMFLADNDGNVYIKGFGLTSGTTKYLSEKLRPFGYTNSTEMSESDFPEMSDCFARCNDDREKDNLLFEAQSQRRDKWDELLQGQTNFKGLGLTYSLNDLSRETKYKEISAVIKAMAEYCKTK